MAASETKTDLPRLLDGLSKTFLELIAGDSARITDVNGVAFHDPIDDSYLPRSALVLGVGVHDSPAIAELLLLLGQRGAAGLVVRSPVELTSDVRAAVDRSGVPLIGLTRGASWAQLAAMARSLLDEDGIGRDEGESLGGVPSGDLFALANAITAMIDAPVTIEDRNSHVLAFSERQGEADSARVETILGRQVPERFTRTLLQQGVFHHLYRSEKPVWIDPEPPDPDQLPRVAVAVRAGDEVLGSIWAVVREPLSDERMSAFSDAAKLVALHMMRIRAGAHGARRLRADLVSTALEGGPGTRDALRRLGLADEGIVVIALGVISEGPESVEDHARRTSVAQRLSTGLAMHLTAVHPRSAAALIEDVCYGMIPEGADSSAEAAEKRAVRIATQFLAKASDGDKALIGVGSVARGAADLAKARASAERVLRVLLDKSRHQRRVARFEDVHVESLLLELRDLITARGDRPTGPVARLMEHDAKRGSEFIETLQAWLDAFGDVGRASAALFVHPNTFRYRLRRIVEVSGLDLEDPEARLAAMVQLRMMHDQTPAGSQRHASASHDETSAGDEPQ